MAKLVLFCAGQHIEILLNGVSVKSYFFNVVPETAALRFELEELVESLVKIEQTEELANGEQVRSLSTQLGEIAYDAEDVVDNYVFEIKFYSNLIHGIANLYRAHHTFKKLHTLRMVIQQVKAKLDEYMEESTEEQSPANSPKNLVSRSHGGQSSNSDHEPGSEFVVGIQNDVEKLVTKTLLKEGYPEVLAIVGMGGSGKTTLARSIYTHSKIKKHFKYRVWVSLAHGCPISQVPSEICRELQKTANASFFWHQLWANNCLIVLDNVWDLKSFKDLIPKLFEPLESDLRKQLKQIKIVITSRQSNEEFSDKWQFHEVQLLNEKDAWDLFTKVSSNAQAQDHRLRKEIFNKCEGLPLAIVVLGKLLKTKDTIYGWERVLSHLKSNKGQNDMYLPVNNILAISYHDLPYSLKPCFLYFGVFPKNSTIKAGRLMRMWIAEGFVKKCSPEETLENAARRILQVLIERTMVQVVEKTYAGKPKTLQVHSLMTDLCLREAKELNFLTACSSEFSDQADLNKSRRAAVNVSNHSTLPVSNSLLRSLLLYNQRVDNQHTSTGNQRANLDLVSMFKRFKLLRVLDINGINTSDGAMPKDIGNLIHLRYLRIRSTNIIKLPDTIGNLGELVTFVYRNVVVNNDGIILPDVLWKLSNLRHLYLPLEKSNRTKSFTLHTLKNLQTLWGVRAGKWMIREISKLNPNLNKLCIHGIENDKQIVDSLFNCPLIKTQDHIRSMVLEWHGFSLDGLQLLCSKKNLQKLRLKGNAPDTLEFPSSLQKIELYGTQLNNPKTMEALGELPNLRFLRLAIDSYVGNEWNIEGRNMFPQLEVLELSGLPNLERWEVEKGAMPCLKRLSVESCDRLKLIPDELRSNNTLEIRPRLKNSNTEANTSRDKLFG